MNPQKKSYKARKSAGAVRVRKNIRHLNDTEVNDLRRAYEGLYAISEQSIEDQRGYQWIAGVHGRPLPIYCQHGTLNFTTWHRAYIYEFERRLQAIVPSVTLPYWDWTSAESIANGMPAAVTVDTYIDNEGNEKPNPLKTAFSQVTGTNTVRNPQAPSNLQFLADRVNDAMLATTFTDFSPLLESPHGGLHGWVGGDMGSVPVAAYDPIFWLHHCNVDRQWWQWQQKNPTAEVPQSVKDFVCVPFPFTGEQTLDVEYFGYTYAESEAYALPDEGEQSAGKDADLPPSMKFALGKIPAGFEQARLEFHGLKKTANSYEIRVFANEKSCDVNTDRSGRDSYAGSHYIFGHGSCYGAKGHCDLPKEPRDKFDRDPEHHLTPYNTFLNVTKAIRAAIDGGKNELTLYFVVVDGDGNQAPPSVIEYEGVALVTR